MVRCVRMSSEVQFLMNNNEMKILFLDANKTQNSAKDITFTLYCLKLLQKSVLLETFFAFAFTSTGRLRTEEEDERVGGSH